MAGPPELPAPLLEVIRFSVESVGYGELVFCCGWQVPWYKRAALGPDVEEEAEEGEGVGG